MKPCTNCVNMIADNASYCNACNTVQRTNTEGFEEFESRPQQYSDTFLKVLCILTIIGAVFSLIGSVGTFTSVIVTPIKNMQMLTYFGLAIAVGKLAGAILMLTKKLIGLYIYTAAAVVGLAIQFYSVSIISDYSERMAAGSSTFVFISVAIGVLFLLAFLIMYWLPVNRRHLS